MQAFPSCSCPRSAGSFASTQGGMDTHAAAVGCSCLTSASRSDLAAFWPPPPAASRLSSCWMRAMVSVMMASRCCGVIAAIAAAADLACSRLAARAALSACCCPICSGVKETLLIHKRSALQLRFWLWHRECRLDWIEGSRKVGVTLNATEVASRAVVGTTAKRASLAAWQELSMPPGMRKPMVLRGLNPGCISFAD